jgi:hypothetical protein
MRVPQAVAGQHVLHGPERVRSELRWRIRLPDGRTALLAQLLPELARDESLRRRYVRDCERLRDIGVEGVAEVLAIGPSPDPRAPDAEAPWRLRVEPEGEPLEAWLERRSPAPLDEVSRIGAALADVLHHVHAEGAVIRDLHPRRIVLTQDQGIVLTDVGLARVDILSTRTAASLMLEGSPYASPEQLTQTTLDQRSDLYGLGVILWRALTGTLPFGDGPALLLEDPTPPDLQRLRPEADASLAAIVRRCLLSDPRQRPDSAADVAAFLRGERAAEGRPREHTVCQACGDRLRVGQRLCLSCGKVAVQFFHSPAASASDVVNVEIAKLGETEAELESLRGFLQAVSNGPVPDLNFIVGDARMYSKEEQASLIRLPATLFREVAPDSARALTEAMKTRGLNVRVARPEAQRGFLPWVLMITASLFLIPMGIIGLPSIGGSVALALGIGFLLGGGIRTIANVVANKRSRAIETARPLLQLRPAPAALPASDPLVARLAALLEKDTPADVREQIGELALLVQRLVDHRSQLLAANAEEASELEMVIEPIAPLLGLIEREVAGVAAIDRELAGLDEGAIVRALEASRARKEPASARQDMLTALDRLRALEDQRAASFHRLLEASSLLRRATEMGLSVQDARALHERHVELARLALGPAEEDEA